MAVKGLSGYLEEEIEADNAKKQAASENDIVSLHKYLNNSDLNIEEGTPTTSAQTEFTSVDEDGEVREKRFSEGSEAVIETDDPEELAEYFEDELNDGDTTIEEAVSTLKKTLTPEVAGPGMPAAETLLILEALNKLIDKIDKINIQPPIIHVPAPIIEVTLPDIKRTITKTIHRNDDQFMTHVTEEIEDHNLTEPTKKIIKEDSQLTRGKDRSKSPRRPRKRNIR